MHQPVRKNGSESLPLSVFSAMNFVMSGLICLHVNNSKSLVLSALGSLRECQACFALSDGIPQELRGHHRSLGSKALETHSREMSPNWPGNRQRNRRQRPIQKLPSRKQIAEHWSPMIQMDGEPATRQNNSSAIHLLR